MKPFRGFADPLCLLACGLYVLNRAWLRAHVGGAFLEGYFNDLLMIPAALPLVLWLHGRFHWRDAAAMPSLGEIGIHVGIWSLVCEVVGPHWIHRAVGDPFDVGCYAAGGGLAWLWWHRPRAGVGHK